MCDMCLGRSAQDVFPCNSEEIPIGNFLNAEKNFKKETFMDELKVKITESLKLCLEVIKNPANQEYFFL